MNDRVYTALLVLITGMMLVTIGCVSYSYYVPQETITVSIIDKWMDVKNGYLTTPMCELEDHRIFRMNNFEYMRAELNKQYQMKIYPDRIEIINERWRL